MYLFHIEAGSHKSSVLLLLSTLAKRLVQHSPLEAITANEVAHVALVVGDEMRSSFYLVVAPIYTFAFGRLRK